MARVYAEFEVSRKTQFKGVTDIPFFLYRLMKSCAREADCYWVLRLIQKVGYITANENGANLTAKAASKADKSKQTWTCTQNPDQTWTFTLSVGGETWTMYTTAGQRLAAGTDAGSNFKAYTMLNHDDDPSNAYAAIKMIEGENVNSFVNLYYGQRIGNEYGPWSDGDNGSKVYFVEASEIELHSWDFDFKIFDKKNNATRYFIQFNSPAANNPSYGPTGLGGRTGKNLVLSVDNDTLISDSVIVADANFKYKVWHVNSFDPTTKQIVLVNEAGQYINYVTFDTPLAGGSNVLYVKNAAGKWVRNGNSGGGILTAGFMATTVPQTLYVFDSNKGSECYSIGDSSDRNSRNFLNAWGNVGWHHFMGKWEVNDINNALKFIPITEVFNDEEIATMDKLTGISNVNVEQKQANTYVYTIDGRMVGKDIKGLAKGLYIVNGKKVVVK